MVGIRYYEVAQEPVKMGVEYFLERDIENIDPETNKPSGIQYDRHIIQVNVSGQIFKESFVVTDELRSHNYREEAELFGLALMKIGKAIKRQARGGVPCATVSTSGSTHISF